MENDSRFRAYMELRGRAYERLDQIRRETDGWMASAAIRRPPISEIARVMLLLEERAQFIRVLQAAEEDFLEYLLGLKDSDAVRDDDT